MEAFLAKIIYTYNSPKSSTKETWGNSATLSRIFYFFFCKYVRTKL